MSVPSCAVAGAPSAESAAVPLDLAATSGASPPRVVRVGLLGHGRVGRALCRLLAAESAAIERRHGLAFRVATVLVRDAGRTRSDVPDGACVTSDVESFLAARHDVVVEALGGAEPAATIAETLLARGTHVVTANKLALCEHASRLRAAAVAGGASLRFEASVAAGVPLFSVLAGALATTRVSQVTAILNGTSNFVLTRLAQGCGSVADALADARRLGLAEPDASLDVRGTDAAHKLRVLAFALTGDELPAPSVEVHGIGSVRAEDCARAAAIGHRLRPVARADLGGAPRGWVAPAAVPESHPLAHVGGAHAAVLLRGDTVEDLFLAGPGAGPIPTAASIVDDLIAAATRRAEPQGPCGQRTGGAPRTAASPWFVSFVADESRASTDRVLSFLAEGGVTFRRLREIEERGATVVTGITAAADPAAVSRLAAGLRTVGAVREITAFRAVATHAA